ncbi:23S rRNA (cytidine(2498)-2'-O)-methyltransferase RlmM [Kushneria phosphatilytica]|uniref:Ribosomal RNA large subunit methyltransferase M n=1 Tax=Kushneria phosphatilytica TaxID=657387 RepID=A0A1S1NXN1_9GAMM|nr:23S rRNA (cytidine(2498)-2'-O)-methyltransferase RlmM [Kushneria phosphatilytica]OHV12332.1 23S rRNA (cytidine(2498)-2'-O)-methyltransferase RlmM [Kushneria phosphatilytica]QEL11538.1 23S rRNA (cytidine(2498)-2'-O)-methyltransferase RlmM [Kushneria phosphatilytica]
MSTIASELLFYCRIGFEQDLASELSEKLAARGYSGYPIARSDSGLVRWCHTGQEQLNEVQRAIPLVRLVFARQSLLALAPLEQLSREDRITAIVEYVVASGWSFERLLQETPDTNEARALSGLMRSLQKPLESVLKKRGALRRRAGKRWLHLCWTEGNEVQIALSFPGNRSDHPGGIRHLRFPAGAPSRSTLKLEEAWHTFIAPERWSEVLGEHCWAVDLGAAPGGWSWQLVQRGMSVYAIDNGPMDNALLTTGQIEHLREDAFHWQPPHPVEWLVCDIVEQPSRVAVLMGDWLIAGWCQWAVFNLKLPMKQRWPHVREALDLLEQRLQENRIQAMIRCRHLYHDREEVTVLVEPDSAQQS